MVWEVQKTKAFQKWFDALRDERAKDRIDDRILRLAEGNPGDVAPVGEGVSELRIHYGPGYRVYFTRRGQTIFLLLCGGDKATQNKAVKTAKKMATEWDHGS